MSARKEIRVRRLAVTERERWLADFRLRQPAVLSGGLAGWPDALFDFERLAGRFGGQHVHTYKLPSNAPSARMSSIKSDFYFWSDEGGQQAHLRRWTFGEFIESLRRGEAHYCMANRTKNTRLRDLLAAEAGDVDCEPIAGTKQELENREFFFGSDGAGPGLHHDGPIETFLCQLIGTKQVNVFSPMDIPYLYPAASWLAPTGHFSSVADSFFVDATEFPLFARATVYGCQLDPGDVLYIPPHWYHDTSPRGPTASMTIRNAPPAEVWGTRGEREALAKAAAELYACLRKLPPDAQATFSALLLNDLDKALQSVSRNLDSHEK